MSPTQIYEVINYVSFVQSIHVHVIMHVPVYTCNVITIFSPLSLYSSIQYKYLEESAQNEIKLHFKGRPLPEQLYFNKGL